MHCGTKIHKQAFEPLKLVFYPHTGLNNFLVLCTVTILFIINCINYRCKQVVRNYRNYNTANDALQYIADR